MRRDKMWKSLKAYIFQCTAFQVKLLLFLSLVCGYLLKAGGRVQTWTAAEACCEADVMGEGCRLIQTATDWSALKPESFHNFTLLNSAIAFCVGCRVGGNGDLMHFQPSWRVWSHASSVSKHLNLSHVIRCIPSIPHAL